MTSDKSDHSGSDVVFTPSASPSFRHSPSQSKESIDEDDIEMAGRPPMTRTHDGLSQMPLLRENESNQEEETRSRAQVRQPFATRRNTFRSRSPSYVSAEDITRKKYLYAAFCLVVCLVSFVVQTETAVYIQHDLKWNKAYCMLWLTHGSWSLLWPLQLIILRIQKRNLSWAAFWRRHKHIVKTTGQMVRYQDLHLSPSILSQSPWTYMLKMTAFVTSALTVAGASWYVAVNMTTPSDLTAIYNCSAFFAYVFSIILLNDRLRLDKMVAVAMAIAGVLVVAYGDREHPKTGGHSGGSTNPNHDDQPSNKLVGNLIIGVGSVLYGLYEVLYKKYACPPEGCSPGRGMIFANSFGSMVGCFTLGVLWIPIPILHYTGLETFEIPRGKTAALLAVSTLSNATFSGAFLILMSLTSPVLSSVAALLTIFLVAITDWFITGKPLSLASITGGLLIVVAFALLSWATFREMTEEQKRISGDNKVYEDEDQLAANDD